MKRAILLIPLVSAVSFGLHAQTMTPGTLNATGGTNIIGANEFDWSIGEMTLVSTFTSSGVIVTQGVLQPSDATEGVPDNSALKDKLKVFPNPASTEVNIQYAALTQGTLAYRLLDMNGKVLGKQTMQVTQGANAGQVDVKDLACATYLLEVTVNAGESTEHTSYKIQKIK